MSSDIPIQTLPETTKDEAGHQLTETEIFEQLSSYPFNTDHEFAKGLSIILGHPESPASEAEISRNDDLVLQAKCYYFSRKEKLTSPLKLETYKSWLESLPVHPQPSEEPTTSTAPTQAQPENIPNQSAPAKEEPAYPTSFAHIVELITTGQPIPGIQEIPDTVLAGQDAPSSKAKRRKPWEKDELNESS